MQMQFENDKCHLQDLIFEMCNSGFTISQLSYNFMRNVEKQITIFK